MPAPRHLLLARAIADALIPSRDEQGRFTKSWDVWEPPASRAIERVRYRRQDGTMTVRFRNRPLHPDYLFWNVPPEIFQQWKRVKSAGAFYHRRVSGVYGL